MKHPDAAVHIYPTRTEMGAAAADAVRKALLGILEHKAKAHIVFASAPSQVEFLAALIAFKDIPWQRVVGFHLDEYFGIAKDSPQSFGFFLRTRLFDRVPIGRVEYIDPTTTNPASECERYAKVLTAQPLDIMCLGIGENGHIAFNDPPIADFNDPLVVKIADLDEIDRQQQLNDGGFASLADVPRRAITLTIPTLLSAPQLIVIVPGPRKAQAVYDALRGPISPACPASTLRGHNHVDYYLDVQSAALLG